MFNRNLIHERVIIVLLSFIISFLMGRNVYIIMFDIRASEIS